MIRWWSCVVAGLVLTGPAVAQADGDGRTMEAPGSGLVRLAMPAADPARGRELFVAKGCIACHAINELGGTSAPPLDAEALADALDPLEFVARMWRGAEAMIFMQQQTLGEQLDFTGQELADIIAFVRDPGEQARLSETDVPPQYRRRLHREPDLGTN